MAAAADGWSGWSGLGGESMKGITRSSVALLFFNLLDGLFTLTFLQLDLATEANPLMRLAYQGSPVAFMLAKLAMVNAGLIVLCIHHRVKTARVAIHASAVMYAAIVAYHLSFLLKLSGA
jgi:hypothetical protein